MKVQRLVCLFWFSTIKKLGQLPNCGFIMELSVLMLLMLIVKVSVFDSVVQGGDSVWEGLRVYDGKVFKLEEHLDR